MSRLVCFLIMKHGGGKVGTIHAIMSDWIKSGFWGFGGMGFQEVY